MLIKVFEVIYFCRNNLFNKGGISLLDVCVEVECKIEKLRLFLVENGLERINLLEFVFGK